MKIYSFFTCSAFCLTKNIVSSIQMKRGLQLYMKKSKSIHMPLYLPKTANQEDYVNSLNNYNTKILIATGPAGSGKTLFACQKAITEMNSGGINKIIVTRPVVSVDEEIGFLPGNIIKKMDPWTRPIFDIFLEHYSKMELDLMLMNGKIEICPLAFMRGRTFKHSFIIADEMQNSSPNQMKMLATRLGDNSRMIITGDLNQTDIEKANGLNDFVNKIESFNGFESLEIIKLVKLNSSDIERSEAVKMVLEIYDNTNTNTNTNTTNTKNDKYDAALIPIQHVTRYRDVFSNQIYF